MGGARPVCLGHILDRLSRLLWGTRKVRRINYLARAGRRLGLLGHDMYLLRTLAKRSRLPHPASMLLSPANLAYAARMAPNVVRDPRTYARLNELCVRLFGTALPDEPERLHNRLVSPTDRRRVSHTHAQPIAPVPGGGILFPAGQSVPASHIRVYHATVRGVSATAAVGGGACVFFVPDGNPGASESSNLVNRSS